MYAEAVSFDYDTGKTLWLQWLCQHEAFVQSTLYTAAALVDLARQGDGAVKPGAHTRLSRVSREYLGKTLKSLNERLASPVAAVEDVNITIIVQLALISLALGNADSAMAHSSGLGHIIMLRGGRSTLMPEQQIHLNRYRTSVSTLDTGFFH
jgi:hypothetical protein